MGYGCREFFCFLLRISTDSIHGDHHIAIDMYVKRHCQCGDYHATTMSLSMVITNHVHCVIVEMDLTM
jgi:hypothetical protein